MSDSEPERFCPACGATMASRACDACRVATIARTLLPTDPTRLRAGDVVAGRYRVRRLVGRGGNGAVYAAEHLGTRQEVAIKLMIDDGGREDAESPRNLRRFHREAAVASAVRHRNLVAVHDFGQIEAGEAAGGALFLVMELLQGETLEAHLRELAETAEFMPWQRASFVAAAMCGGLEALHARDLVHRDVKPSNVMLAPPEPHAQEPWRVVLLDFGSVRGAESTLTGSGHTVGTPAYMSPEQCAGAAVDGRSDLYAVGVLLFRCVTGRLPFDAQNGVGVMHQHVHRAPPDLRAASPQPLSDAFVAAVMRALAKRPAARWQNARSLQAALIEAVERGAQGDGGRGRRGGWRGRAVGLGATTGITAAVAAGAVWAPWPSPEITPAPRELAAPAPPLRDTVHTPRPPPTEPHREAGPFPHVVPRSAAVAASPEPPPPASESDPRLAVRTVSTARERRRANVHAEAVAVALPSSATLVVPQRSAAPEAHAQRPSLD